MVVAPGAVMGLWPWRLTAPHCRVIGGWRAAPGVCDLLFARAPRRSAWRVIVPHQARPVGLIPLAVARQARVRPGRHGHLLHRRANPARRHGPPPA
jgi:hypothetical protein